MFKPSRVLFSLFAAMLAAIPVYGQINWRPINPQELALKIPMVDKDADAEAIFWNIWMDDSQPDKTIFRHYLRVKVFTARGVESQSRVDLTHFGKDKITDIFARTIKADGSILDLKKDAILERALIKQGKAKYQSKSFVMPGVEPGAIVEYQWKQERSLSPQYLRLDFQREIPSWSVSYFIKPYGRMAYQTFHMHVTPIAEKGGYSSFSLTNVPAFREEPRMPPEAEVRPWVLVSFASTGKSPEYWNDLGKLLYEIDRMEFQSNDDVKKAALAAVGDATTPEEKLRRLFDFCRAKITNPFDDASDYSLEDLAKLKQNRFPADTLKRGVGTPYDIDLLFGAMAIAVGFDVRISRLPDRNDIFFDPKMANRYFLSRYDVAVKVGDSWRLFDPANRYATFGMLDWREEGVFALVPDRANPAWVTTPLSAPSRTTQKRNARLKLSADGTLEGDVDIVYSGHINVDWKEFLDDLTPEEQAEQIASEVKDRLSTAEVSAVKLENVKDSDKPLTIHYHVRVPQYGQRTGSRLFFEPNFFHGKGPMFPSATRTYAIYFHYPWSENDDLSIELPPSFEIENGDSPGKAKIADVATHDVTMQLAGDGEKQTLRYQRQMAFGLNGRLVFPVETYTGIKEAFDALHQRDAHVLTLKTTAGQ